MRKLQGLCAVLAIAAVVPTTIASGWNYLGQATIKTGEKYEGTEVGGLSGIVFDANAGKYYSISDDRSQINPARFYSLTIDLADGSLTDGDVAFTGVTTLLQPDGTSFPAFSLDPEGIALTNDGDLYVSSEGDTNRLINPFVNRFGMDGKQKGALDVPTKFLPTAGDQGIRNNLAFETLTFSPTQKSLFTATENALKQDGPAADLNIASPSRVLRFDTDLGKPAEEFLYFTEPVTKDSVPPGQFKTNGLVDMLAVDETHFYALERSFSTGVGNTIKIFEVSIDGATDISGTDGLNGVYDGITPVSKTLILDLDELGITLDNIEGITWGPKLDDGRQSIIVVSDNNFASSQFTQFIAFAIPEPSAMLLFALTAITFSRGRR